MMTSREIAELTGKQHKHVIRDIREMLDALSEDGPVLDHVREDRDARGYTTNFHLDRELTETLITGYSIPLRHRVIRRLHELEERAAAPAIPQTYSEALRVAADLHEQNTQLRMVVNEQAPKVEALGRIAEARGTLCLTDTAKHLNIPRHVLLDWMHENRWIYRREGSAHWLAYQPRMAAGLLEHRVTVIGTDSIGDQCLASQVRVTPKGLAKLAQKVAEGSL
ncbi:MULTISPECIES: phage regulatory protein/antirepressor Ant [unclassified Pseudomonas]|uniref:phage antirepressor KilAC domain-containing protein n=1 Tax=unclassified Pseudomonas TaxID=196821 RepID=UPI00072FD321|nr:MULTISPECIES: phage regulatory protein/antirepressor Ant [unclassified Pseudomonas]KSW28439.1 DNA-binding protein [Pseudomonas sp. ADP]